MSTPGPLPTASGVPPWTLDPLDDTAWRALVKFVGPRAVPGVEEAHDGVYRRTLRAGGRVGVLSVEPAPGGGVLRLAVQGLPDEAVSLAERGVRRMLDLDADTGTIDHALAGDPILAPLVAARPGLRAPGAFDGWELAVRAIVGQQVTVAAASTLAGRVVRAAGVPLPRASGALTHGFPLPEEVAATEFPSIGMPGSRVATLQALGRALAEGRVALDGSVDAETTRAALVSLPGIGPWTANYISMRALGDPDAFPIGDVGLRRAAERLGLPSTPRELAEVAERWRPYRTYAVHHLWASLQTVSGG